MKKSIGMALVAGLAIAVVVPGPALAQRRDRQDTKANQQRVERGRDARAGGVPAFCRSGAGHPVFGRAWCADRGWDIRGNDRVRGSRERDDRRWEQRDERRRDGRLDTREPEWRRANFGDVRFRIGNAISGRELSEDRLAEVIGDRAVARIARHAHEIGATARLIGVWEDRNPLRLRVFAGRIPIADLIDENQDLRVDIVRLAYYR